MTLFSWIELALVYGLAAPIVLPLAAATAATHYVVTRWLLLHRGVPLVQCAAPPLWYLQLAPALQAALATWFFSATQGAAYGWTVGIVTWGIVVANAAGVWHWYAHLDSSKPAAAPAIVENERGVRLTMLGGPGAVGTGAAGEAQYALMNDD